MTRFAPLLLAFVAAGVLAQGTYRWVDKAGKVHYSDEPPEPAAARQVEEKRLTPSVVGTTDQPYETRRAARLFPVTLFVSADCGEGCGKAREFLARLRIPFAEKAIATPEDADAYRNATRSNTLSVPTLLVGNNALPGYEEGTWTGALEAAGYAVGGTVR